MGKEIRKEFDNGVVREEFEFSTENNLKDGLCKIYDRYGDIEEEIFYVAGKKQGKSKKYYKGEWTAEGEFFDGKKTGIWLEKEYGNIKKYIYFNGEKKEVENFKIKNNNIFNYIIKLVILILMLIIIFFIYLWNKNDCLEKKVDKNYKVEEILNYPKKYEIIERKKY
jgi:hypothetical protein